MACKGLQYGRDAGVEISNITEKMMLRCEMA